jgi:hypothetical protein
MDFNLIGIEESLINARAVGLGSDIRIFSTIGAFEAFLVGIINRLTLVH